MYGTPQFTPDAQRFLDYIQAKQTQWAGKERRQTRRVGQDHELAAAYVIRTQAPALAQEFENDEEFINQKICDFINNARDEEITSLTVSLAGWTVPGLVVDAASITLDALRIACRSKKGQNLALPILAVGAGLLLLLLAFGGKGKKG